MSKLELEQIKVIKAGANPYGTAPALYGTAEIWGFTAIFSHIGFVPEVVPC